MSVRAGPRWPAVADSVGGGPVRTTLHLAAPPSTARMLHALVGYAVGRIDLTLTGVGVAAR